MRNERDQRAWQRCFQNLFFFYCLHRCRADGEGARWRVLAMKMQMGPDIYTGKEYGYLRISANGGEGNGAIMISPTAQRASDCRSHTILARPACRPQFANELLGWTNIQAGALASGEHGYYTWPHAKKLIIDSNTTQTEESKGIQAG